MAHFLKMRRSIAAIAALSVVALLTGCKDVHEAKLANGMRIIVKEDHRSPVVASMVWYTIGSMDEPEGLTGISHVLEHMMFKGTERLKPNEFSRIIAEHGGRENAFTNNDYTAYFQQLEKSRLPISFKLEADRMRNLRLDEAEFRKEIQVVMEERRLRTEDQPEALVYERFMNEAYRTHPYGHPVIGWMRDLERIEIAHLRDWYHRWYAPSNATLVVVGDVNPSEVFALARKYFGALPAQTVERPSISPEPPQTETRRITVTAPAQVPYLLMGYHAPVLTPPKQTPTGQAEWEPHALAVLIGILDGGQAARLERELVREQRIASRVLVDYDFIARAPTMLILGGTPAAHKSAADLEQALRAQVERLQREPVSGDELQRVKAQVVASEVYARDSVFYQAMQLGHYALAGLDVSQIDKHVARIQAVTAAQVMAVARKYLTDANLTIAVLDPQPPTASNQPAATPAARAGHGH